MRRFSSSAAAVILFSLIVRVPFVLAQDKPLAPVPEMKSPGPAPEKTSEKATVVVITGKVSVIRDPASYKVTGVDVVGDDGSIYKVLLDGRGKKLTRVLKSKIVHVTGELKGSSEKPLLAVNDWEIVGSTKKIETVHASMRDSPGGTKTNAPTEPVVTVATNVDIKPGTNLTVSGDVKPSTNLHAAADVSSVSNQESRMDLSLQARTNTVSMPASNSVPALLPK